MRQARDVTTSRPPTSSAPSIISMRLPGRTTRVRTCIVPSGIGPRNSEVMRASRMSSRGCAAHITCASSAVGGLPC